MLNFVMNDLINILLPENVIIGRSYEKPKNENYFEDVEIYRQFIEYFRISRIIFEIIIKHWNQILK